MPLPAILSGVGSIIDGLIKIDDLINGGRAVDAIEKAAAQAVLDALGVPLDLDGEVNQQTITQAINAAVLPAGCELTNIFDKQAVQADIKRIALAEAAAAFGFDGPLSADTLRAQITAQISAEVRDQIAQGAGEFIDAAKPLAAVQRLIDRPPPKDWQSPRKFTENAEKNRERQARYRASHTRKWIAI